MSAELMRGIGGSTLRGGQTVFHAIRMWGQLFRAAMLFAAFATVAVPAWTLWRRTTDAKWYAAGMVTLAEVKLTSEPGRCRGLLDRPIGARYRRMER